MKNKIFPSNNIDPFSKNAKSVAKIYHEVLLLMEFLQTKPEVKNTNNNYYDFNILLLKLETK